MLIGFITEATPRIRAMLAMLLPTILPTVISLAPWSAAVRHTTNSGEEVPKATTVRPIITGLMPRSFANRDAPLTSNSPPAIRPVIPIIK